MEQQAVVPQFEILPNQRPERPLFSGSCLLYAGRQTLAQGHRHFCCWPVADLTKIQARPVDAVCR